MFGKDCLATKSANPFQGKWINDNGSVDITNYNDMKCKIEISTANGAHTCELHQELTVLSNKTATFQVKNLDTAIEGKKKFFPITLSLSNQIITVTIPQGGEAAAGGYCGARGFFEGEYTNSNTPRVYKTSFNCDQAKTKIEIAICQTPELANADIVLSKLYFQLKAKQLDNMVNQQKKWIKDRNLCTKSTDLNQCLSDKYSDRILSLQQQVITNHPESGTKNSTISYNYDYLLYLAKLSQTTPYDIFQDPPLQNYLKAAFPKDKNNEILSTRFYEIQLKHQDDSLIMITGGAPGLYTIYEGALLLTNDHLTWLAYINIDDDSKTQIIILCPKGVNSTAIPKYLKQWVDRLLPHMDYKDVIYKMKFPLF